MLSKDLLIQNKRAVAPQDLADLALELSVRTRGWLRVRSFVD